MFFKMVFSVASMERRRTQLVKVYDTWRFDTWRLRDGGFWTFYAQRFAGAVFPSKYKFSFIQDYASTYDGT